MGKNLDQLETVYERITSIFMENKLSVSQVRYILKRLEVELLAQEVEDDFRDFVYKHMR